MSKQEDLYTGILARLIIHLKTTSPYTGILAWLVITSLFRVTGFRFSPGDRASSLCFMAFMERINQTRTSCSLSK